MSSAYAPTPPAPHLLGVIILTYNSAQIIRSTVERARRIESAKVLVIDSFSSDETVTLVKLMGGRVVQREFLNYSEQRNWAISEFGHEFQWQLHLDADELLDPDAIQAISDVITAKREEDCCYLFKRLTYFLGHPLLHGGASSFHLRLFRSGTANCEDRLYDQHFVSTLKSKRLKGVLHDTNSSGLAEWVSRHNRWSTLEAEEIDTVPNSDGQVVGRMSTDPRERRRFYKKIYYRLPRGIRVIIYFLYRYVVLLGFLDGSAGFYYAVLQVLWFRTLVDAKLFERTQRSHLRTLV